MELESLGKFACFKQVGFEPGSIEMADRERNAIQPDFLMMTLAPFTREQFRRDNSFYFNMDVKRLHIALVFLCRVKTAYETSEFGIIYSLEIRVLYLAPAILKQQNPF